MWLNRAAAAGRLRRVTVGPILGDPQPLSSRHYGNFKDRLLQVIQGQDSIYAWHIAWGKLMLLTD